MSVLAKGALLGIGALAAYRLSEPSTARSLPPPKSKAEGEVRAGLGGATLCRATVSGELGAHFGAEYLRQVRALAAEYGSLISIPLVGTFPALPAACCAEWLEKWLGALKQLYDQEPLRFNFAKGGDQDPFTPPVLSVVERLAQWTGLPAAWREVVRDYQQAKAQPASDAPYPHAGALAIRLRAFADELDRAARKDLSPSAGAYVTGFINWWGDTAKAIATTTGNALAWGIEEVAAPAIGAVGGAAIGAATSALAPYLIIAGVGYLAWRQL